jgi:RNA-directed DNA polymerase
VPSEKFFDRINHDKLMAAIARRVTDKRVLRLIGAFLKVGVMENGLVSPAEEGTPQGGPLSPLLSNIVLDELDRELERRKHCFVRYADDCNIYVRSQRAGQRVMMNVTRLLTRRLKLKVNEAKSAVARPEERKFLGFSFSNNKEPKRRIAPQAESPGTDATDARNQSGTNAEGTDSYVRGWKGYFGFCQTPSLLQQLDRWIRHRLRSMIWKQWKYGQQRYRQLRQRGVGRTSLHQRRVVRTAPGGWRTARPCRSRFRSPTSTLSGFPDCSPATRNPLNRPMRTRTSGGVAGESGQPLPLCRFQRDFGRVAATQEL